MRLRVLALALIRGEGDSRRVYMLLTAIWSQHASQLSGTVNELWRVAVRYFDAELTAAAFHDRDFFVLAVATGDLQGFNLAHGLPRRSSRLPRGCCDSTRQDFIPST